VGLSQVVPLSPVSRCVSSPTCLSPGEPLSGGSSEPCVTVSLSQVVPLSPVSRCVSSPTCLSP
ncbi:hypothetical protein KUCAC02_034740, partial [Chaenocephalus aceratus]